MPDKKNSSSVAESSKDSTTVRKKKPTLSQQVTAQAEKIEQLNAELQQKEQELASLLGNATVIDELDKKLQKTKKSMQAANKLISEQAERIDKLSTSQAKEMEQHMTTAAEQEELIDELRNRLEEVDKKLATSSLEYKYVAAKNSVKSHMVAGMSLALIPAPLFDIAALTGTQLNMLRILCKHYDIDFDEQKSKALLTSLVSGSLPVVTVLGLSSFAKLIPGIGTVGGSFSMTILSGATIYATGEVFIRHFSLGGTLENFDVKYWKTYFKQELEEGKLYVRSQLKKKQTQESSFP